jgi:hypothetical protein
MVLQRAPEVVTFYGWDTPGAKITVNLTTQPISTTTVNGLI